MFNFLLCHKVLTSNTLKFAKYLWDIRVVVKVEGLCMQFLSTLYHPFGSMSGFKGNRN